MAGGTLPLHPNDYSDASPLVGTAKSNTKTKNLSEGKNLSLGAGAFVFPKSA
jgi:hypothetical protein